MKKIYTLFQVVSLTILSFSICSAQQNIIDNEDSLKYYLNKNEFEIDKNATAVILYESGKSFLKDNVLSYKVERVFKIINASVANEIGTVAIPANNKTSIKNLKGFTYNLKDGKVEKQEIEKADFLKDKVTNNLTALKFNLPSLKEGSIVYYGFTLEYLTFFGIPDWYFQHDYPTLFSTYQVDLMGNPSVADVSRMSLPFEKVKSLKDLEGKESAVYNTVNSSPLLNTTTWVRRNIPALKDEVYRKGANNYLDRVRLQQTHFVYNWTNLSEHAMKETQIYSNVYDANSYVNSTVEELTKGKADDLAKAKAIYAYLRDNFILADNNKDFEYLNPKRAFACKKGKQKDINQLLIIMLLKIDLDAELVMLSAKPNESMNPIIPNVEEMNYMVTKVVINNKDYFLDPIEKYLPFGQLLPKAYNGYSRVMSKKWREIYLDDNLLEDKIITVADVKILPEDKKITVTLEKLLNDVTAFRYRDAWKGDEKKARLALKDEFGDDQFIVDQVSVENIANPDEPLKIRIIASSNYNNDKQIYLNGFIEKFFKSNPLPPNERKYPVVFNYHFNYQYFFHLEVPEGFFIEYMPESKRLEMENQKMAFSSLFNTDAGGRNINLRSQFSTSQNTFEAGEYNDMRSFFDAMISEQNKSIIIKKEMK